MRYIFFIIIEAINLWIFFTQKSYLNLFIAAILVYVLYLIHKVEQSSDRNAELTQNEKIQVILTMLLQPVLAGAFYYYTWKSKLPIKAKQVNKYSWIIVGIYLLLFLTMIFIGFKNPHFADYFSKLTGEKNIIDKKQDSLSYAPTGYIVKLKNHKSGYGYETYLTKGENYIALTKSDKYAWTCNGTTKTMGSQEVCYGLKKAGISGGDISDLIIIWNQGSNTYEIETDDKAITDQDLINLVSNFQ